MDRRNDYELSTLPNATTELVDSLLAVATAAREQHIKKRRMLQDPLEQYKKNLLGGGKSDDVL